MILLITAQSRGPELASLVNQATSQETHWAQKVQQAAACLREHAYSAVVRDQFLLETEPEDSDQMIEHLGTAFPVYINFAVTGLERLIREVRSALHRRMREEAAARRSVPDSSRARCGRLSPPCCSRANWRCQFPMCRWWQRKRSAPSTRLPANYACGWK